MLIIDGSAANRISSLYSLRKCYDMWKPKFWKTFEEKFKPDTAQPSADAVDECPFEVKYVDSSLQQTLVRRMNSLKHHHGRHRHQVGKITMNRELITSDKFGQSTKHIEMDISETGIEYEAGQNIGIQPANDKKLVKRLIKRLDLDPKAVFTIIRKSADRKRYVNCISVVC